MDLDAKKALLDVSLERAAEQLGDITPHVMEAYYRRHPEARRRFEDLASGERGALEQQMVDQALYCLMVWVESPLQIEIILNTTVPHHMQTLDIPSHLFSELIAATCATIVSTIPPQKTGELALWNELHAGIKALVDDAICSAV